MGRSIEASRITFLTLSSDIENERTLVSADVDTRVLGVVPLHVALVRRYCTGDARNGQGGRWLLH